VKQLPFTVKRFGPNALLLEWIGKDSTEILFDVLGFSKFLKEHFLCNSQWELVPIYNSLTIINTIDSEVFVLIGNKLYEWYSAYPGPEILETKHWELPVCYDSEFGLDLEEVSRLLGMEKEELIKLHGAYNYRVFGLGFLPGFLYLGGVPDQLQIPRKASPRMSIPKGSVGLAGFQTGIYPQSSPGGWNIIGNCPVNLFDASQNPPCFINPGDTVKFIAVSRAAYDLYRLEVEVGVYDYNKKFSNDSG
jgi:inhibitor of KinA